MYGQLVTEPRLTGDRTSPSAPGVPELVATMAQQLDNYYHRRFTSMFCNYYRDGADSVAWHADRVGRYQVDPLVAIVSLGGPRTFRMRPMVTDLENRDTSRAENVSTAWQLYPGDLLIMGGATQHHWLHTVPKTRRAVNPRMSVTLRTVESPQPDRPGPHYINIS